MRRGELFELHWDDIDLGNRILKVRAAAAKGSKSCTIPLNPEALDVLKRWSTQQADRNGLVFKSKGGGRFIDVKTAWHALLTDAQIKRFNWHALRHCFASKLVQANVSLAVVQELLGHSDPRLTLISMRRL
jgi:integrase